MSRSRPGTSLKRIGTVLFLIGLFLLFKYGNPTTEQTTPKPGTKGPTPSPPVITLDDAKTSIPRVLKSIYAALDKGSPQDAAPYINSYILNDSRSIDYICQPFSYRAHYVDSIVERPGKSFWARVRTLFKPDKEKAYWMYFGVNGGSFYLSRAMEDDFAFEKELVVHATRQFIFAAKAGEWEAVRRLSSPQLDISPLKDEKKWQEAFSGIRQVDVRVEDVDIVLWGGLKLRLFGRYDRWITGGLSLFFEPSADPRVVGVKLLETSFSEPGIFIADPNIEEHTLARFGLKSEE